MVPAEQICMALFMLLLEKGVTQVWTKSLRGQATVSMKGGVKNAFKMSDKVLNYRPPPQTKTNPFIYLHQSPTNKNTFFSTKLFIPTTIPAKQHTSIITKYS